MGRLFSADSSGLSSLSAKTCVTLIPLGGSTAVSFAGPAAGADLMSVGLAGVSGFLSPAAGAALVSVGFARVSGFLSPAAGAALVSVGLAGVSGFLSPVAGIALVSAGFARRYLWDFNARAGEAGPAQFSAAARLRIYGALAPRPRRAVGRAVGTAAEAAAYHPRHRYLAQGLDINDKDKNATRILLGCARAGR